MEKKDIQRGNTNTVLDWIIREIHSEQVPEWNERMDHEAILGKNIVGSGNNKCRAPWVVICLACSRNSKEAGVAQRELAKGEWLDMSLK